MVTPTQALLHAQRMERLARMEAKARPESKPQPEPAVVQRKPQPQSKPVAAKIEPTELDKFSVTSADITPMPCTAKVIKIVDTDTLITSNASLDHLLVSDRQDVTRARKAFARGTVLLALEEILKDVVKQSPIEVTVALVKSSNRRKVISDARLWFYYRAVTETDASYSQIAEVAGVIDHTTVMHGISSYCIANCVQMPRYLNSGRYYARVKNIGAAARKKRAAVRAEREAKRAIRLGLPQEDQTGQGLLPFGEPSRRPQGRVPPYRGREGYPQAQNVAGQACKGEELGS